MSTAVIAISETWLQRCNSDLLNLPGYDFMSYSREHELGGGGQWSQYIQPNVEMKN